MSCPQQVPTHTGDTRVVEITLGPVIPPDRARAAINDLDTAKASLIPQELLHAVAHMFLKC